MDKANTPQLIEIKLLQKPRLLQLTFDNNEQYELSAEYLRVFSPSAEVRGHGLAEPILVAGKASVNIIGIEPVGQYAIKLVFDDGHDTGLYTWDFLYELAVNQIKNWQHYCKRLQVAGLKHHE